MSSVPRPPAAAPPTPAFARRHCRARLLLPSKSGNGHNFGNGPSGSLAMEVWHGTTIIGVRKNGKAVIAGDGQVSLQSTVIKPNAKKVRRIGATDKEGRGKVIGGFAGATADAFTLFERLEKKLETHNGQ